MGIEIEVNSLEDMCALMCDNVIPKRMQNAPVGHHSDRGKQPNYNNTKDVVVGSTDASVLSEKNILRWQ